MTSVQLPDGDYIHPHELVNAIMDALVPVPEITVLSDFSSQLSDANARRYAIQHKQKMQVFDSLQSGDLPAIDESHTTTREWKPGTQIVRADVVAYLARCGLSVNAPDVGNNAESVSVETAGMVTTKVATVVKKETGAVLNARRYQMCIDAALKMPDNDYSKLPEGIGALAKKEGITKQAFSKSVKKHLATVKR